MVHILVVVNKSIASYIGFWISISWQQAIFFKFNQSYHPEAVRFEFLRVLFLLFFVINFYQEGLHLRFPILVSIQLFPMASNSLKDLTAGEPLLLYNCFYISSFVFFRFFVCGYVDTP